MTPRSVSGPLQQEQPANGIDPRFDPKATRITDQWQLENKSPLVSCRFDPSGRWVAAGAQDNTIRLWNLETEEQVPLEGHESWVRALSFSKDGTRLFSADFADRLLSWDLSEGTPRLRWNIEAHQGWIRSVDLSPDQQQIATCGHDHVVKIFDAETGELKQICEGHDCHVYAVAFHPGGDRLVSCDLKGGLRIWDANTGGELNQLKAEALYIYDKGFRADIGGARAMRFNQDGTRLACAGITKVTNAFAGVGNPVVLVFDWDLAEIITTHEWSAANRGVCWGVAFHPSGTIIGTSGGGAGGYILFWNPGETKEFHSLKLPNSSRDLDLHPDGLRLATAHFDGTLRISSMTPKEN